MNLRSDTIFQLGEEATSKFDYFITGTSGALFAYIAQTYVPAKLALNGRALEPAALLLLAAAFFCGIRRSECTNTVKRLNHQMVYASEEAGAIAKMLVTGSGPYLNESTGQMIDRTVAENQYRAANARAADNKESLQKIATRAEKYYDWRMYLLIAGFVCILVAKISTPYLVP